MKRLEEYDAYPVPTRLVHCDHSWNCRGYFEPQSVAELAADIEARGLKDPIDLQPGTDVPGGLPGDKAWRVVGGHRRFIAVTMYLKWPSIPAKIHHGLSELQARVHNLQENDKRKNLNPLQEALALDAIIREYPAGTPARRIYTDLGKDSRWFGYRVDLLSLPDEIQQMIAAGRITLTDIEIIKRRADPAAQIKYALALADAKKGKGHKNAPIAGHLTRSFKRRRNKAEINALIEECLNLGVTLKGTRALAWAAGYLSDAAIRLDIQEESGIQGGISNVSE